jgi:hypothetical protein
MRHEKTLSVTKVLWVLSAISVYLSSAQAQTSDTSLIEQQLTLPSNVLMAGEPIFVELRWTNRGNQPVTIRRLPSMYSNIGLRYRKDNSSDYNSVSIFPTELRINIDGYYSGDAVLMPGEYIVDSGVYAFFGATTGYETGKYMISTSWDSWNPNRIHYSNEFEITVVEPDDDELFRRLIDVDTLEATQGWQTKEGLRKLEEITKIQSGSHYVSLAKFYLKRTSEGIDSDKRFGNYYIKPGYKLIYSPGEEPPVIEYPPSLRRGSVAAEVDIEGDRTELKPESVSADEKALVEAQSDRDSGSADSPQSKVSPQKYWAWILIGVIAMFSFYYYRIRGRQK